MATTGSLQIKNGKYYAVLSLRTNELTKSGKIKYKTKWISTGFKVKGNKKRAQQFLREKCLEYDKKNLLYCDMYLCDYFEKWIKEVKVDLRANTYRGYAGNMKNHIIPYFKPRRVKLQDLKPCELEDFYKHLLSPHSRIDGSQALSTTTITHIHRTINKALNDAMRKGIIMSNPASVVKTPHHEKYKGEFLNQSQVQELIGLFKDTVLELPVILCAVFGFRRGETLGLKWKNIDLINRTITICETLQQTVGGSTTAPPKTDSSYRTLPIPESMYNLLLQQKERQDKNKELLKSAYVDEDYVCTWEDGRVVEPNYLTRKFHKTIMKSDLPKIRLHDLRHSVASNLLNMGFTVVQVAEWLGHSSSATTLNFYAHVDKTGKMDISDSINKSIKLP